MLSTRRRNEDRESGDSTFLSAFVYVWKVQFVISQDFIFTAERMPLTWRRRSGDVITPLSPLCAQARRRGGRICVLQLRGHPQMTSILWGEGFGGKGGCLG